VALMTSVTQFRKRI